MKVEEITAGLENGWDVGFLPDGKLPERLGKLSLVAGSAPGSAAKTVAADFSDVLVAGEGGLMGLVVHPDFVQSRDFTTCQTHKVDDKAVDIRLVTPSLSADGSSAARVADLLTGLPVNPSGRHSGCRPTIAADGAPDRHRRHRSAHDRPGSAQLRRQSVAYRPAHRETVAG